MNDSWDMGTKSQTSPASSKKQKETELQQENWSGNDDGDNGDDKRNELDESNWLQQIKKSEKEQSSRTKKTSNNTSLPNTSFLHGVGLPIGEYELAPDEPNTTFFNDEDKKKQENKIRGRGNRDYKPSNNTPNEERENTKRDTRQKQEEVEAPRRGNRQRQEDEKEEKDGGVPRRGNRTYRDGEDQTTVRRGNRDTAEGGGGFKKKEYYQARESQYERGNGGYRGYRGGYRGRGGNNYNSSYRGYNPRYTEKNDNEHQEQERGGGYKQRQWGSRNYQQDRQERNNHRYEGRNYNQNYNRPQRYQNQQYREPTRSSASFSQPPPPETPQPPQSQPQYQPQTQSQVQLQPVGPQSKYSHISETQKLPPKGRKCWPQMSLHILSCRIAVTARQLSDFRCKLLVMPYSTIQMEYYPGNIVNSSEVDYRKKIVSKGSQIQQPGSVYLQKALSVYTFSAIAFVKVSRGSAQESLKKGIIQVLKLAEKIQKPITLQSLVFPICSELGDPSWVVQPFLSQLQNCRKIKQVWITTIQGSCYSKAVDAFNKHMDTLFKSNEIFLN